MNSILKLYLCKFNDLIILQLKKKLKILSVHNTIVYNDNDNTHRVRVSQSWKKNFPHSKLVKNYIFRITRSSL